MSHRCNFFGLLLAINLWLSSPLAAQEPGWKAGAAKISITPTQFMWMSGYAARTKPAEGKLNELWARALVLEDPTGTRGLLVTLDLVGIDRDLSQGIVKQLSDRYKLPRASIIISTSHTHSGPVVRGNLMTMYSLDETQKRHVIEFAQELQKKVVAIAGEAIEKLEPVKLAYGHGQATFAVNRRNNKEAEVPKLREAGQIKGPFDHDLPVMTIRDAQNRLKAIVCGYACHATVLDGYLWSGDYPGFGMDYLEKDHSGAIALFWAGCGADQNPIPRRKTELADQYGRQLADAVSDVMRRPLTAISGRLAFAYTEIDLPFGDLPTRDDLVKDTMSTNKYTASRARHLLDQIGQKGSLKSTYPYPVQAWQLGNEVTWVALGGEVVVDYALRLKKELGPGAAWIAGYCNDVMAYIPSLRVLKEGGYEGGGAMVYYGQPTAWGPRVEDLIVAAVHDQVKQARRVSK